MRKLLVLLLLGSGLWSGYWVIGSSMLEQAARDWLAGQEQRGWTARTEDLGVAGFPNRFDLTATGVALADPQAGIGWQAPFVQVFAMTWKPWHVIAALPPDQTVTLPDQTITLASEGLRASLRAKPSLDVPLANVSVESGTLSARSSAGWGADLGGGFVSLRARDEVDLPGLGAADVPNAYVLQLELTDLLPDQPEFSRVAAEAGLPPSLSTLRLLAVATLTAPLDRRAGETPPRLAGLELSQSLVAWGDLSATATGTIGTDDKGFAAGRIDIAVTNWQPLVPALVAAGAVSPQLAPTVQNMLAALANDTGDPNVLNLPLLLSDGVMSLGPLPLGPAPLLLPPSG